MRVLFVSSGNSERGISPIVKAQGESLINEGIGLDYYTVVGKGIKGYLKNIKLLKKVLRKSEYDVVHAHYGFCGIVAALSKGKEKLVVSFMGSDLLGSANKKSNRAWMNKQMTALNVFFSKFFYDFIIVKSQKMREKIKSLKNVEIVANGVNTNIFEEAVKNESLAKLGWDADSTHVIFVSNPERKEKNYKLAEQAVNLIGGDNVTLKPVFNLAQEELPLYYSAADVLILTSLYEGSPNVIKEAMACNLPIVATDVGDVKWIIQNTDGCYITNTEPEDAADKLRMAIRYGREKGRTNGRERIKEIGLDSKSVAQKIISIYDKLVEGESG